MKKIALMAMGLAGVLAACDNTAQVDPYSTPTTNWSLTADLRDATTGKLLKKGDRIICDNKTTIVNQKVSWSAATQYIELWEKGASTSPVLRDAFTVNAAGSGCAQFTYAPGTSPLSLDSQSIVVNPVAPQPVTGKIKGYTYLGIQGSPVPQTSFNASWSAPIPVLDCQ